MRALAAFGAGSAAIHQLRYAIGYGDAAPHALATHGHHGYLEVAFPGLMTAALIALAAALMRVARRPVASERRRVSLMALWLGCTLALAAIFAAQETLEGAGALAGGGWIGLVLAIPAGLLVALALRGADAAEISVRGATLRIEVLVPARVGVAALPRRARIATLRIAARAPPLPCVV
jgi:hypothetical protein